MIEEWFIQSLAIVFLLCFALSVHLKNRIKILLTQAIGLLFLSVHFLLLEAWTGMAVNMLQIGVLILFLYKKKSKIISRKSTLISILALFLVTSLITFKGAYSLLAFLAISSATMARWQDRAQSVRLFIAITSILWISYDIFVLSYGGIIAESIILVSTLSSLIHNKSERLKIIF